MATPMTKAARLAREQEAWDLSCRGWTHGRIAQHFGIDRTTVCHLLNRIYRRTQGNLDASVLQKRSEFCGVLRHILGEELDLHERAKQPRKRASRRTAKEPGDAGGAASVEMIESVDGQGSLPALASAKDTIARIIRLEGLEPPALLPVQAEGEAGSVAQIATDLELAEKEYDSVAAQDEGSDNYHTESHTPLEPPGPPGGAAAGEPEELPPVPEGHAAGLPGASSKASNRASKTTTTTERSRRRQEGRGDG